jgi:hypothetical protein
MAQQYVVVVISMVTRNKGMQNIIDQVSAMLLHDDDRVLSSPLAAAAVGLVQMMEVAI